MADISFPTEADISFSRDGRTARDRILRSMVGCGWDGIDFTNRLTVVRKCLSRGKRRGVQFVGVRERNE